MNPSLVSSFVALFIVCLSCESPQPIAQSPKQGDSTSPLKKIESAVTYSELEKRLLDLLEIRPERVQSQEECLVIYALDSSDRYVYPRILQDPTQPVRFEMDVPQAILDTMSTRLLLKTCLGHPTNIEYAPFTVCSSLWRCRESMFQLHNAWRALEQRSDGLEECLRRYDRLNILCDSSLWALYRPGIDRIVDSRALDVLMQTCLIESFLTRPAILNQLSPNVTKKLAAKVLAKHRQKDMIYQSELGKTHGLWLLGALMTSAKDTVFIEEIEKNTQLKVLSLGFDLSHTLSIKNLLLQHAERFTKPQ